MLILKENKEFNNFLYLDVISKFWFLFNDITTLNLFIFLNYRIVIPR